MEPQDQTGKRSDIALAEFKALRDEIQYRTVAQNTLVSITLVAAGAIAAVIFRSGDTVSAPLALVLAPLATATGLFWLDHAKAIFQIGAYIRGSLWPELEKAVGELPSYEKQAVAAKNLALARSVLLTPFLFIFFVPSVAGIIGVFTVSKSTWMVAAAVADSVIVLGFFIVWLVIVIPLVTSDQTDEQAPE